MSEQSLAAQRSPIRWGSLIVAAVIFGLLMALREEFVSIWIRAGIAACAALVFWAIVTFTRRVQPPQKLAT